MKFAISASFAFLIIYAASVLMGLERAALFMFSLSPLVVLYVVYKILKDPKEVTLTFEDHFYQDGRFPRVKPHQEEDREAA